MSQEILSFQDYAFAVYTKSDIRAACLHLQDDHHLDVVMLLYCCWLGRFGVFLESEALQRAVQAVEGWRREVVQPLRKVRRALRMDIGVIRAEQCAALRQVIQDAELSAEILQIDALQVLAAHLPARNARTADRAGLMRTNLSRYLALQKTKREEAVLDSLERVITGAVAV